MSEPDPTSSKAGITRSSEETGTKPSKLRRYEPKPLEAAAAQRISERRSRRSPAAKFNVVEKNGTSHLEVDHPDLMMGSALLIDSLATDNAEFAGGLLTQLANLARSESKVSSVELNALLATVHEIAPRDPTEALLACHMAAIHKATMVAARRLNNVERIDQQDSASNMLNKLARTFATQVETLKRYRSSGEQSVRVTHQHVNVTAGQAVVGIRGGGGTDEKRGQSHVPSGADERSTALPSPQQAFRMPVQSAGDPRPAGVPVPRGESRSAEGGG